MPAKHLQLLQREVILLLALELVLAMFRWMAAAWLTGSLSPPFCHMVYTPNHSQSMSILRQGVMPPPFKTRTRTL